MPFVQAKLDDATFKEVKKDAIDKDVTVGTYVKEAVVARLEQKEAGKELTNETNIDSLKGDKKDG
jgi:hypothetical protein